MTELTLSLSLATERLSAAMNAGHLDIWQASLVLAYLFPPATKEDAFQRLASYRSARRKP